MDKTDKDIIDKAVWAVNAFDQANTGCAIEAGLGSRGKILADAINELRDRLNEDKKLTILTTEQARCTKHIAYE